MYLLGELTSFRSARIDHPPASVPHGDPNHMDVLHHLQLPYLPFQPFLSAAS